MTAAKIRANDPTELDWTKRWFLTKEVMDYLQVTRRTVYNLIERGTLEVITDHRNRRIYPLRVVPESLMSYIGWDEKTISQMRDPE